MDKIAEVGQTAMPRKTLRSYNAAGTIRHPRPLSICHSHIAAESINEGSIFRLFDREYGGDLNPDRHRHLPRSRWRSHLRKYPPRLGHSIGGQTLVIKLRWANPLRSFPFEGRSRVSSLPSAKM